MKANVKTQIIILCQSIKRAIDDNEKPSTMKAIVREIEQFAREINEKEFYALLESKHLFESVMCICAEGIEFYNKTDMAGQINNTAQEGYDLCKEALNNN